MPKDVRVMCKAWLLLKTEAKDLLSTSAFSMLVEASSPSHLWGVHSSVPSESILWISCQIQFYPCPAFSHMISACPDSIPVFFPGFHYLYIFFFSLSLTSRPLVNHASFLPPLDFLCWEMESSCASCPFGLIFKKIKFQ